MSDIRALRKPSSSKTVFADSTKRDRVRFYPTAAAERWLANAVIEEVRLDPPPPAARPSPPPYRFSQTPPGISRRAPRLGEHTDSILSALGLSGEEIASLRSRKIV